MQHAQQLGRYHLLDRVAFGGMAEIYRAKTADAQGRLHVVAVKRVLGHLCEDDEFIQMLIDEARLTALLKHPNIARVYEFSKFQSEYFISMEYVDGKDMRALLERARQNQEWLPEHLIAYIGMQVARGLHAAHIQTDRSGNALNIVHRDVSPSNVLLSYGGDVKLCDFGIAKASGTRSQTKTGVIKGKVKYMSPEQAMGRKLDHRSDLFSLGTLLYEMLTLQAPFTATTEIELLFAVRDARKRPIRELRPNLHAELEIVIDRAMAKSRSQRFQNGEEFANSLQAFLDAHYPNQGAAALSQYLRASFAKEIERENAVLSDYIIDGVKVDTNVGENLLADVLGPDAEYTQFTAAFGREAAALPGLPEPASAVNPNQQMRVLHEVTMPGAEEFDALPTAQKDRLAPSELGVPEPVNPFSHSARTMPRVLDPPAAVRQSAVQLPNLGDDGEPGQQTVVLQRQTPPQGVALPAIPTAIKTPPLHPNLPDLAFDDHIHVEETRILPRQQMDLLAPAPLAAPRDGLHEASTQILDARSLPPELQQLLQKRGAALLGGGAPASKAPALPPTPKPQPVVAAPPPAPPRLPKMPSLELTPLDSDFHEANTAYLDWSPLEPETGGELPMPDPSSAHLPAPVASRPLAPPRRTTTPPAPAASARPVTAPPIAPEPVTEIEEEVPLPPPPAAPVPAPAPAPVPARAPTGLQPAVAKPTGLQQPIVSPRPLTGMQQPIVLPPTRSPTGLQQPIVLPPTRSPTGAQQPIAPPPRSATGVQQPIAPPRSATGMQQPIVLPPTRSPTGMQQPIAPPRSATGMQQPIAPPRSATGMQRPISAPPRAATGLQVTISGTEPPPGLGNEEWESLPHLDSTMLAHPSAGGSTAPAAPPTAMRKPGAATRDAGDLPTIRPRDVPRKGGASSGHEEPAERTINEEELPAGTGGEFEDLPTPVKGPAVRDVALDSEGEFAEDTNKGDGPRGMTGPGPDASLELNDDDFESLD